jgi:hypothetical protein
MPAAILSDVPIIGPYLYFVSDEDVVLVAPDTREVVELIPKRRPAACSMKPVLRNRKHSGCTEHQVEADLRDALAALQGRS